MGDTFVKRLKGDKVIWVIVIALSLISIAAVYSSSSSLAFREDRSTFFYLMKQLRFVILGLIYGHDSQYWAAYCDNAYWK